MKCLHENVYISSTNSIRIDNIEMSFSKPLIGVYLSTGKLKSLVKIGEFDVFTYNQKGGMESHYTESGMNFSHTYDKFGNVLTSTDSSGYWQKYTRDESGKVISYIDSTGCTDDFKVDF